MVITDLLPETSYSITVAAYTMKGDGARSKPKVVTTKGAGASPTAPHRSPARQGEQQGGVQGPPPGSFPHCPISQAG